jgi:hypothetical protein
MKFKYVIFFTMFLTGMIPSQGSRASEREKSGLSGAYVFSLAGPSFFQTPSLITNGITLMGYNAGVTEDLIASATYWENFVDGHLFILEYHIPIPRNGIQILLGALYRGETAVAYSEIFYQPPYVFSGTEMVSNGGGLYAGLSVGKRRGKISGFTDLALAYFNFSRTYLYSFYLDPQSGGKIIEKRIREKTFSSGPGIWAKAGFTWHHRTLSISPFFALLWRQQQEMRYSDLGPGIRITYPFPYH